MAEPPHRIPLRRLVLPLLLALLLSPGAPVDGGRSSKGQKGVVPKGWRDPTQAGQGAKGVKGGKGGKVSNKHPRNNSTGPSPDHNSTDPGHPTGHHHHNVTGFLPKNGTRVTPGNWTHYPHPPNSTHCFRPPFNGTHHSRHNSADFPHPPNATDCLPPPKGNGTGGDASKKPRFKRLGVAIPDNTGPANGVSKSVSLEASACPLPIPTSPPPKGTDYAAVLQLPGWLQGRFTDYQDSRFGHSLVTSLNSEGAGDCFTRAVCEGELRNIKWVSWQPNFRRNNNGTKGVCLWFREETCSPTVFQDPPPFDKSATNWLSAYVGTPETKITCE